MEADLALFFDNFRFTIYPESSTPSGRLRRSGQIPTLPFLSLYWVFNKTQFYRKNGTQLQNNRWLKLAKLTPWDVLNELYLQHFCVSSGLIIKLCRLIMGLMIGKHILKMSDRQVVGHFHESPYFQYFCGMDSFMSGVKVQVIHPSLLSKRRLRLGKTYFEHFETEVVLVLVKFGLVDGKTVMSDATVVPSDIEYPNDVKLMNEDDRWKSAAYFRLKLQNREKFLF